MYTFEVGSFRDELEMKGTALMNSRHLTLVTPGLLRNQFMEQDFIRKKENRSHLTTDRSVTLGLLVMLLILVAPMHAFGQSTTTHPCLSPYAIAIQQTLQAPCEQVVENASLESLLDSISSAYEIPIWCDRRIARDALVTLKKKDETLESFLKRAIEKVDAALIPLAGVVMIAPKATGDAIEAAHWRLAVSRPANSMQQTSAKPFGWPDGSVASTVVQEFASRFIPDSKLTFKTEHDIWRAFEFRKATTTSTIGTCLLSGFDLCVVDLDSKLNFAPISEVDPHVTWTYSNEEIQKRIGESAWKSWRQQWPDATISRSTKPEGWRVLATVASHRGLISTLIPRKKWEKPKPGDVGLEKKGFSGALEGELELVIRSLAAQTKLEFFPIPLPSSLETKKVKLKLDKTPLDDILKEITKQTGVRFKRDGQRVEVIP